MASSEYSPQRPSQTESQTAPLIPGYSDDEARDIYARASEIQSQSLFQDERMTPEQLTRSANRAGISDAALERAIKEREQERLELAQTQKLRAAQKARLTRNGLIGGAVVASMLGLTLLSASSRLGARQQAVLAAQSQVENVQQRRYELVPNLIRVTKSTLTNQSALISSLQTAADAAKNAAPEVQGAAQENLKNSIEQTMQALKRDDPASPAVRDLTAAMEGSDNRIAVERRKLAQATQEYNRAASGFPTRWAAKVLGYRTSYPYFQASEAAQQAPKFE